MESSAVSNNPARPAARKLSFWKRWSFRLLAVLLGLSPLIAWEGVCRFAGWGKPAENRDPFVGFHDIRPLFVLSDAGDRYEIPASRQNYFRPESFSATKPTNETRIFCLGGSTVQGRPFAIETSFTTWLELALQTAEPGREWNAVNCGGVSYASYRLLPILQEVLTHEPDLIVIYTGHNEFLEADAFDQINDRGIFANESISLVSKLRIFNLLRYAFSQWQSNSEREPDQSRPLLPTEVDALLDYQGGLERYHRNDTRRQLIVDQYRQNVKQMIAMCQQADVAVVLLNPVCNWRDCPPMKALPGADLSANEKQRWNELCEQAETFLSRENYDLQRAIELYEEACRVDSQYADGFYHLAQCYEAAGRMEEARTSYLMAKELDICPLRILQPMNQAVLKIATDTNTPLIDAQALIEANSQGNIAGDEWLLDHVHPSIRGHQLIADALAKKLAEIQVVRLPANWEAEKSARYKEHLSSMPDLYFHKGSQRLAAVRRWAQGRGTKQRLGPAVAE